MSANLENRKNDLAIATYGVPFDQLFPGERVEILRALLNQGLNELEEALTNREYGQMVNSLQNNPRDISRGSTLRK